MTTKRGIPEWMCGWIFLLSSFAMIGAPAQGFAFQAPLVSPVQSTVAQHADQVVVYKSKRMLYLLSNGRILRKYHVALGKNPVGHKLQWGDNRTPEGKYTIDLKNANSGYYRSLRISYPDATDADVATALEVKPGDWIMIHGLPNDRSAAKMGHPYKDWTNGCIAVTDAEMDEIWQMVDTGTPISIWP
ncbi:MAG: hypothetical protein JWM96_1424 [Alphaproteobacteria bacterium]|nr:hypothetical protein [Alphaproteobacteria bacterium]